MCPGTRSLPRLAILMAALVLAAPLPAAARGGGGGHGGGGGGFHGGGFGGMRGGGAPAFHSGFTAAPSRQFSFSRVPNFRSHEHSSLGFRLGSPVAPHVGRNFAMSGPGIPPLRGTAVPPLTGNPVPPLEGAFRGPEIWRKAPGGAWHHDLGFRNRARLSAGVIGFGVIAPIVGVPFAYAPYGYGVEAYGNTCNAAPYFCPISPDAPIGTPCACPLEGGTLAQGWVE